VRLDKSRISYGIWGPQLRSPSLMRSATDLLMVAPEAAAYRSNLHQI
jgi:hypothetical protein